MGVNGLFQWIKAHHGSVIHHVSKRFADPRIRGKRLAIDGTLLTMAMHYGGQQKWGELAPKAALIEWYYLIEEMQQHGVQPYVIWDRKGLREWKAPEAQKRLFQRSLAFARKEHEEKREQRLDQFKAITEKWTSQAEEDRAIIRKNAQALRPLIEHALTVSESGKSTLDLDVLVKQAAEAGMADQVAALKVIDDVQAVKPGRPVSKAKLPPTVRANEFVKDLAKYVVAYSGSIRKRPEKTRKPEESPKLLEAIEEIRQLESASDSLDSGYVPRTSDEHIAEEEVIDEKLKEARVGEEYTETSNQTKLTEKEGEILKSFFEQEILGETREATVGETTAQKDYRERQEWLEQLRYDAPATKQIYENQLNAPSAALHLECRKMLRQMGVPVLYARPPFEAEGLGAAMVKAGMADYVVTEDSDVLAYEMPMIRHASGRGALKIVDGRAVRKLTGFSPKAYLDFCILLGTDASPRLPGMGPATASKLMEQYDSIEELLEHQPKFKDKITDWEAFMAMVVNARGVFQQLPPLPQKSQLKIKEAEGRIEDWLLDQHQVDFRGPDTTGGTLEGGKAAVFEADTGSLLVRPLEDRIPVPDGVVREEDFIHEDYFGPGN